MQIAEMKYKQLLVFLTCCIFWEVHSPQDQGWQVCCSVYFYSSCTELSAWLPWPWWQMLQWRCQVSSLSVPFVLTGIKTYIDIKLSLRYIHKSFWYRKTKSISTLSSRSPQGLALEDSMTCMSLTSSSPSGRGRVISSATSLAASSNCKWKNVLFIFLTP